MLVHKLFATFAATLLIAVSISTQNANAAMALVDPELPGNTQYDGWNPLTAAAFPGYPVFFTSTSAWPGPMGSNTIGSGDAVLTKTANGAGGGPFPAGASIYFGSFGAVPNTNGGSLRVSDASPEADLASVVFQIQIGEAWTYDFTNHVLPTLSYNGGGQAIQADVDFLLEAFDNGTVEMPSGTETVYINTYLLQWDLSGIGDGPITDFQIDFSGVEHAQVYALRLDQYDSFTAYAVPEPATASLAAVSLFGFVAMQRRWRRGKQRVSS